MIKFSDKTTLKQFQEYYTTLDINTISVVDYNGIRRELPITEHEKITYIQELYFYYCYPGFTLPTYEVVEQRIKKFRLDENKQLIITRGKSKKSTRDELIKRVFDNWEKDTILFDIKGRNEKWTV